MKHIWLSVFIAAISIVISSCKIENSNNAAGQSAESSVTVVDSNWQADPSFGSSGSVRWVAMVRNNSQKHVEKVIVEFTTFDSSGRLITSTTSYAAAIPPGETRNAESYADYYGTEHSATFKISSVRFRGH